MWGQSKKLMQKQKQFGTKTQLGKSQNKNSYTDWSTWLLPIPTSSQSNSSTSHLAEGRKIEEEVKFRGKKEGTIPNGNIFN